jgi:hypothetical protein
MSQIDAPPLPKLPLGEAISLSYAWFFQKFADVLRISWLWLVLCGLVIGALNWVQWSWMAAAIAEAAKSHAQGGRPHIMPPSGFGSLSTLTYLIMTIGTASIAVAWHRRIILEEQPGPSGGNIVTSALWRYVGIGIVLGVICLLPTVIFAVPFIFVVGPTVQGAMGQQPNGTAILAIFLIVFVCFIVALAIMLRLSVLLPARAVGDTALSFRQAWSRTRGNIWRMFWGLVACCLPPLIALEIVSAIVMAAIGFPKAMPADGQFAIPALGMTIMGTLMFLLSLLIVPIYIGFLSHSYRHFFQGGIDVDELI